MTWTDKDDFPHDVTLREGSKLKFRVPVGVDHRCSIHPQQMKGTVVAT